MLCKDCGSRMVHYDEYNNGGIGAYNEAMLCPECSELQEIADGNIPWLVVVLIVVVVVVALYGVGGW